MKTQRLHKSVFLAYLILIILLLPRQTAVGSELQTNGSFEDGYACPAGGTYFTWGVGSTHITGWDITSGNIDHCCAGYWNGGVEDVGRLSI